MGDVPEADFWTSSGPHPDRKPAAYHRRVKAIAHADSEELALECFVPLVGRIQQRGKFRIISQSVQQRISL
jgi:hypothetical protein